MTDDEIAKVEMPKIDLPNMEMPKAFREMAENGVEQTRKACTQAKMASEEAADLFEVTYEAAAKHAACLNRKLIDNARSNTRAAFDFVHELLGEKSPSEFFELSDRQMRKQFEILSAQNEELWGLAQRIATQTAGAVDEGVSKAVDKAT